MHASDRDLLLVAALLLAAAAALTGVDARWSATCLCAAALALLMLRARQHRYERLLASIGEDGAAREDLSIALPRLAARFDELRHRVARMHPVTGLPTREHLLACMAEDLGAAAGERLLGALRVADFDRLCAFDTIAADRALAAVAARLRQATAAGHVIAHVDRDCFAIWFRAAAGVEAMNDEFQAIAHVAGQEIEGETVLTPTIETSIVLCLPGGDAPRTLLTRAIVTLAPPTSDEDGRVTLACPPPPAAARERYLMEQDLRRAIDEEQLTVVYQPVVDVGRRRIVGAEALLRWQHPTLGPVSPAVFMPIIELTGQAQRFGTWVLNTALREAARWRSAGLGGLRVAVNLSACQVLDTRLLAKIERLIERHGLAADALELELTETAAMADAGRTLRLFGELNRLGVSLAIDDFGSGYSSLSYLKNLPFDKLKIDREFVTLAHERRDSLAICRALLELGRGLELRVLAEGVETVDEVAALRSLGCTLFQGYFFSRPLAGDAFIAAAVDQAWVEERIAMVDRRSLEVDERLCA